ncbi:hypothetical protein LINPERPRIM_LOCUS35218 [Linum perenne]
MEEWRLAQIRSLGGESPASSDERCTKWHCPPDGVVKCNIDDAIFADSNKVGACLCLRDNSGRLLRFKSVCKKSQAPAKEGEAWALWEGLKWAAEENLNQVVFESDVKTVIGSLH